MVSTIPMPMNTPVAPLTLAEYAEMSYCPALSLDAKFDASVTDDPEFCKGCYWGYEAYFEGRCEWQESGAVVAKRQSLSEVLAFVAETAFPGHVPGVADPSVAWCAGFGVGWLSALALTDRAMAVQALPVLEMLLTPAQHWGRPAALLCAQTVEEVG